METAKIVEVNAIHPSEVKIQAKGVYFSASHCCLRIMKPFMLDVEYTVCPDWELVMNPSLEEGLEGVKEYLIKLYDYYLFVKEHFNMCRSIREFRKKRESPIIIENEKLLPPDFIIQAKILHKEFIERWRYGSWALEIKRHNIPPMRPDVFEKLVDIVEDEGVIRNAISG